MATPSLFPAGVDLGRAPEGEACVRPIGRGRAFGIRRRGTRPPSATLALLATMRIVMTDGFAAIAIRERKIECDLARMAEAMGRIAEALDALRGRTVEIERHVGVRPPPETPRLTRTKPVDQ
jgi:hypothetical protein